ncbi:MAG: hypothetical protein J2P48_00475 [Alphaproteobacteria bacterium]|nr:hypothetical protein [Alphaproteobacteria bacterium]
MSVATDRPSKRVGLGTMPRTMYPPRKVLARTARSDDRRNPLASGRGRFRKADTQARPLTAATGSAVVPTRLRTMLATRATLPGAPFERTVPVRAVDASDPPRGNGLN